MHERILTGGCSTTVWHDSSINSESWDNSPGPATEPTQRSAAYQSIVQWCRNWADLSPLKLDHVRYRTGLGISGGESEWALRGWPGGFNFKFVGILTRVTRDPYCPRATSRSDVQSSDEKKFPFHQTCCAAVVTTFRSAITGDPSLTRTLEQVLPRWSP